MNCTTVLPFERNFDPLPSTRWMQAYWQHSISLSVVYTLFIHRGHNWMRSRPAVLLNRSLLMWNLLLGLFSILGFVRMTPEFVYVLQNYGFQYSMCNASFVHGVSGFWTEKFAFSKALELGDTFFIIMRKRPLIFLHWYHHITVLIYTWHACKDHTAAGRWFIWMNYLVHSFMYSYYAARSMRMRVSKSTAMCVTILQLLQMIVGCFISIRAYQIKFAGGYCQQTFENLYFSFAIYFTYFLLFSHFFYKTYLRKGNRYAVAKYESGSVVDKSE